MMNSYVYLLNRNGQQAAQWGEIHFEPTSFGPLNENSWSFSFIRNSRNSELIWDSFCTNKHNFGIPSAHFDFCRDYETKY